LLRKKLTINFVKNVQKKEALSQIERVTRLERLNIQYPTRNIHPTCLRVPVCVYAQADAQADEVKKGRTHSTVEKK
jgi:hypothetical protein